ncbi:MAG TPA: FlgD immunoglobulin-like domain containing protein, partial [candidate division Zixibacteria bacterium]|nr:FlgD immunoglobulin-like domain containing protein [candidate division Zixibacteria bacterium]
MRARLITALIFGMVLGGGPASEAATFRVPADYHTIQGAIDAADGEDTVLVSDGVWTGPGNYDLVVPGTTIVIASVHGPAVTIIDCAGADFLDHRAFDLGGGGLGAGRDNTFALRGFTIRNGVAAGGGGALVGDRWRLDIEYCIFESNRAVDGGAVSCDSCRVDIRTSRFRYNLAERGGGALYGVGGGVISGCRFDLNRAETGGALADFRDLTFLDCVFQQNEARYGAALRPLPADSVSFAASGTTFSRNRGDAAVFIAYGAADLSHCTFAENDGGLALTAAAPILTDCILADNAGKPVVCFDPMPGRTSDPFLSYCCVSDSGLDLPGCAVSFFTMPNNLIADPMFCYLTPDDYRLEAGSPCVGAASDGGNMGAAPTGCSATDVGSDPDPPLAAAFRLDQNWPNPFNPSTAIGYTLPQSSHVRLVVYDVLGRVVRVLVDAHRPAGAHTAEWDGLTSSGAPAASGVYVYRFTAGPL